MKAGGDALTYTREQLAAMLTGMERASQAFYRDAQRIGFHEFLEIAGFMNELTKICARTLARGGDFTAARPPIEDYEAAYIGEKFGCIFREAFAERPELIRAFCASAFGAAR